MSKFSVKKPLTVFVAVIAVLVLGVVAYFNMTPDLLPNMDFPYIMIMTTYPGASPEKVEQELTKPMEQAMSTLEHIKEVSSTSSENYSMLMLEFEDAVDLDTVGVDIQQNISTLQAGWDEMIGSPYVLKINPSLLPVMVAAVSMEGMDNVELTQLLEDSLINKLEGITGVARVSTSGTVVQQIHVVLDQKLLDAKNQQITDAINSKMDEALAELNRTKGELESAQKELSDGKTQLDSGKDTLLEQTAAGAAELNLQLSQLITAKSQMEPLLTVLKGIQSGLITLQQQVESTQKEQELLLQLKETSQKLQGQKQMLEAQLEQIRNNGQTQQEIQAAIEAFKQTPEYQLFETETAKLEAQLAALGLTMEKLDPQIQVLEQALTNMGTQIDNLKNTLQEQGVAEIDLDAKIRELEAGLAQMEEGIQLLKDSQQALNQAQMEGLLELSSATTQMAVGEATITNAMTQIQSGIDTLETTREQTLAQADLSGMLTLDMLKNILVAQNFSMPAGTVEGDGASYMVSVGDEIADPEELENLLLFDMGMEGIEPIYLKDIAGVMVTDNRDESYARLDGLDGVMLTFEKQSTYATAETTDNILARFEELEKGNPGLHFVSLMNQGDYIYLIVESILSSLLLGAIFAVVVLFLFLKDLRPTFITLCSIPISVIFAIVLMYFSGVTINMISLSGLAVAVGMLVDNSVVVIENIYRLRSKGANVIQAAVSGARQVAGAVTASTLTTVCVFLPIVFVEGITRQLFTDLALTMTYSLLASLIVSLTLVPAMASGMLRKEKESKQPLMDKFLIGYEKTVAWTLKHKAVVLVFSAVLLAGSAVWSLSKGFIFMPAMDMPNVNVDISMPEDATMEEAAALADEVLARIDTLDGIETVGAMMSSGGMGILGGGGDSKNVTVYITLSDESASGAAVGKRIETICQGMDCTVTASSAMMDISILSGSGISLEIYSDDMDALQKAAQRASEALASIEGVAETSDGLDEAVPALHISVDRNKAMQKGITVAQVYMELAAALQTSATATSLNLEGNATDVIVEKAEDAALTPEDLESYPFEVTKQTGETVGFLLSDIATVEQTTSLNSISRLSQRRYITVTASLEEGENVTLVTAQAENVMKNVDLGQGVSYAFTGENETIMEAVEQLGLMLVLGVLLVYLVMVAQFQSLKSPFIVMFTIPLAFTGGFIALLLCGMEISVISLIGFVMLTGIIVNNGIVLVDYINQLRLEGMERREAILEAGKTRMRPILMTTVTTVLGLVDMAVRQNVGTALMRPVAVVCIGGLVYATLMTLYVVPCIYDMVNKKELRRVREEDLKLLDM